MDFGKPDGYCARYERPNPSDYRRVISLINYEVSIVVARDEVRFVTGRRSRRPSMTTTTTSVAASREGGRAVHGLPGDNAGSLCSRCDLSSVRSHSSENFGISPVTRNREPGLRVHRICRVTYRRDVRAPIPRTARRNSTGHACRGQWASLMNYWKVNR